MLTAHASKDKMSHISFLNALTLSRRDDLQYLSHALCVLSTVVVLTLHFIYVSRLLSCSSPNAELFLRSRALVENICTMSGAESKEGQVCLQGYAMPAD